METCFVFFRYSFCILFVMKSEVLWLLVLIAITDV